MATLEILSVTRTGRVLTGSRRGVFGYLLSDPIPCSEERRTAAKALKYLDCHWLGSNFQGYWTGAGLEPDWMPSHRRMALFRGFSLSHKSPKPRAHLVGMEEVPTVWPGRTNRDGPAGRASSANSRRCSTAKAGRADARIAQPQHGISRQCRPRFRRPAENPSKPSGRRRPGF